MKISWQVLIGNDLVDLRKAAAESNWQRKGYLDKICAAAEQELILSAPDPPAMLWLIWTMKEASYKLTNRITGIRSYSPQDFLCSGLVSDGSQATGMVSFNDSNIFISSTVSDQMIHSAAALKKEGLEQLTLCYLGNSPGYAADFNSSVRGYYLTKTPSGLPLIIHIPTGRKLVASVSHHGRYAAIAYSDSLLSAD